MNSRNRPFTKGKGRFFDFLRRVLMPWKSTYTHYNHRVPTFQRDHRGFFRDCNHNPKPCLHRLNRRFVRRSRAVGTRRRRRETSSQRLRIQNTLSFLFPFVWCCSYTLLGTVEKNNPQKKRGLLPAFVSSIYSGTPPLRPTLAWQESPSSAQTSVEA